MPRVRQNPGEKMDCSKRSVTPFQTYVNHLITKKPEKIKMLLARALMNEDSLMDFNGQVHANECVFSYPDSNWYSVYLINRQGEIYYGESGAKKFYFQMDFRTNDEGVVIDAEIINGTTTTPEELMINGSEMKNCVIKESGKCGNPESKKKKKKSGATVQEEDYTEGETPEEILQSLSTVPLTAGAKQKMPRDYFESLGSKSLIIDWMIANMKPNEIFKCIQKGSLSAQDLQQAESLLLGGGAGPSGTDTVTQQEIESVINSFTPTEIQGMIKTVTKAELEAAINRITNRERKKDAIVSLCRRAGVKGYNFKVNAKGAILITDSDGDIIDTGEVIEKCAAREEYRIKKLLKIQSISQDVKQGKLSMESLINYRGGNTPLPYTLKASVQKNFPSIRKYENREGLLYASIPGGTDEDGDLFYYKVDDLLGRDLTKVYKLMQQGTVNFGSKRGKRGKINVSKQTLKMHQKNLKKVMRG
jgi:hypothetical protein